MSTTITETVAVSPVVSRAEQYSQGRNSTGRSPEQHDSSQINCALRSPSTTQGWLTVVASSLIFFTYLGITYSFGIVQLHLAKQNLAPISTLSFIGSLGAAIAPLGCTAVATLIRRIGHSKTVFLGSFLLGLGEITASWATASVPALFITQGLIFGVGAALCFLPAVVVPSLWFESKSGLATGIVSSGAGVGSAVISVSLNKLIQTVGIENSLRVLGGAAWMICLPASYFVRAPPGREGSVQKIQWHLFKSVKFCLLFAMGALATFPLFVTPFLLPLFGNAVGLSNATGALILAGWNLASAFGRVLMGVGADGFLGPVNSLALSLVIAGVSALALWPFSTSVAALVVFALLNGAGTGGFFSLMPVVTGKVFGAGIMANALSMLITVWAFGYFMGAPIAGYLLDAYGREDSSVLSFRPAIFYAGSLTLASAGLVLAVRFMISTKIFAKV